MEFRSLEEFDREFFSRYGAARRGANPYDTFLRDAAPPPAGKDAKKAESGPLQVLYAVISYTIIALLAVGILAFIVPLPFGVKLLNVESGSMQPDYPPNALLWVVPAKYEKIEVGDDVTYTMSTGKAVTHRVINIDRDSNTLEVKGTHNSDLSELISYGQVVGVVRFHVHGLGRVLYTVNESEAGIFIKVLFVLAVVLLWAGVYFLSMIKTKQSNQRQHS